MTSTRPPASERAILLVRHGPGRGRLANYGNAWLKRWARTAPALRRRIRIHETGTPVPSLEGVAAVVFLLADPLRELYPACYAEAAEIAERARARGITLVNPPEALSNTIKSIQAARWAAAGIRCAPCVTFETREQLERALAEATFPVILRADLLHAQQLTHVCRSRADVDRLDPATIGYPGLLVQFVDTRSSWVAAKPESVFARFYHRRRAYVLGDAVVPWNIYFSEDPIVASRGSTVDRYAKRKWWWPPLVLPPAVRACIEADVAFGMAPPEQSELMRRAVHALRLSFAAVDYSTFADGSVVFWEANPHPYMAPWRWGALPFHRKLRRRTFGMYDAIRRFLDGL